MSRDRIRVGDLFVDNTTIEEAAAFAIERARQRQQHSSPALLMSVNAQSVLIASESPRYAEILNTSALSIADGMSVVLVSRLLGIPLQDRVAGVDLVEQVCKRCADHRLSVYFLGGRPGSGYLAAEVLRRRYPGLMVAGFDCPPYGFENSPFENARILQRIRNAAPDILFVALGIPKQEYWVADNASSLGVAIAMPVGGAFELIAALVPRAPRWLQSIGMEWLFRLVMEPRRLWRRYLIGNVHFVALVARQCLATRRKPASSDGIATASLERE